MTRFGLDSNVLLYVVDARDPARRSRARDILKRARRTRRCTLSVQNLGEFYTVATCRSFVTPAAGQVFVDDLATVFDIVAPTVVEARAAVTASVAGRFSYFDALLLATLGSAGGSVMLSEDMRDGASLAGVTVRNPFVGATLPADVEALLP